MKFIDSSKWIGPPFSNNFLKKMAPEEYHKTGCDAENYTGWNYHCIERSLDSNQTG